MRRVLAVEQREAVIEMVRSGVSKSETARRFNVDTKVVAYWCDRAGLVEHGLRDEGAGDAFVNYIMDNEERCNLWCITLREKIKTKFGEDKLPSVPNRSRPRWGRLGNGKVWQVVTK